MANSKIKKHYNVKKKGNSNKYCPQCGTENKKNADFCSECGVNLKDTKLSNNAGIFDKISSWWNSRSKKGKAATGTMSCCFGVFLFLFIIALLFPVTALTMDSNNIQIDDKTTEVIIKGTSESNATVNITATDLNITDVKASIDSNGKFEYKLKIPIEITEAKVTVKSQVNGKSSNFEEVTIQRPVTPLTVIQPADIDNKTENITLEGDSDPQSTITLNSNELNLKDVVIHPDFNGHFKYVIQVPINITNASISLSSVSPGKRKSNVQSVNIKRIISQPAPQTPVTAPQPQSDSTTSNTNTYNSNTGTSSNTATQKSGTSSSTPTKTYGSYIGNSNPNGQYKFHHSWCGSVKLMNEENKVFFSSREAAIKAGYNPCLRCNP